MITVVQKAHELAERFFNASPKNPALYVEPKSGAASMAALLSACTRVPGR
jgi:hypothetical protein